MIFFIVLVHDFLYCFSLLFFFPVSEEDLNQTNGTVPHNVSDPSLINTDQNTPVKTVEPETILAVQTTDINTDLLKNINRFHQTQKKGSIDVWWLFDDGGRI